MGLGSGVALSCGVGRRHGLDPALLWLWCRPAAAALIRPLAWEPPHAVGVTLKRQKKKKSWQVGIPGGSLGGQQAGPWAAGSVLRPEPGR